MTSQEAAGDDNIKPDNSNRVINTIVRENGKNTFEKVVMQQGLSDSDNYQQKALTEQRYRISLIIIHIIFELCTNPIKIIHFNGCLGSNSWLVPLQAWVSSAGRPSATHWWTFPQLAPCPGSPSAPLSRPWTPTWRRRTLTRRSSGWGSLTSRGRSSRSRGGSPSGRSSVSRAGSSPRAWSLWRGCSPSHRNTRCHLYFYPDTFPSDIPRQGQVSTFSNLSLISR